MAHHGEIFIREIHLGCFETTNNFKFNLLLYDNFVMSKFTRSFFILQILSVMQIQIQQI